MDPIGLQFEIVLYQRKLKEREGVRSMGLRVDKDRYETVSQ